MITWSDWFKQYPDGEVLTVDGVMTDRYLKDAYGDYAESEKLYMPVSATDARLHPKRVIYGMEIGDDSIAIDAEWLLEEGQFANEYSGKKLVITVADNGEVDASLDDEQITIHRMYWFAWYSFHPRTALIDGN